MKLGELVDRANGPWRVIRLVEGDRALYQHEGVEYEVEESYVQLKNAKGQLLFLVTKSARSPFKATDANTIPSPQLCPLTEEVIFL